MVFSSILALDALSKYWIQSHLPLMSNGYPYGGIGVSPNFHGIEFSIVHATNKGAAWGTFAEFSTLLLIFRIILIGFLIYYYFKHTSFYIRIPLALIIAGAFGNVLDIYLYGHVVDMFHFIFFGYDYPVFNIADSAICIGVALYLIFSWIRPHDSISTT